MRDEMISKARPLCHRTFYSGGLGPAESQQGLVRFRSGAPGRLVAPLSYLNVTPPSPAVSIVATLFQARWAGYR
jgi:hypothetical protein